MRSSLSLDNCRRFRPATTRICEQTVYTVIAETHGYVLLRYRSRFLSETRQFSRHRCPEYRLSSSERFFHPLKSKRYIFTLGIVPMVPSFSQYPKVNATGKGRGRFRASPTKIVGKSRPLTSRRCSYVQSLFAHVPQEQKRKKNKCSARHVPRWTFDPCQVAHRVSLIRKK